MNEQYHVDDIDYVPLTLSPSLENFLETVLCGEEEESKDFTDIFLSDDETVAASSEEDDPELQLYRNEMNELVPVVSVIPHLAGEPVYMTGAVASEDSIETVANEDDHIDCDIRVVLEQMPYKPIRSKDLLAFDLGLNDQSTLCMLPDEFVTTYLGIQLALNDLAATKAAYAEDEDFGNIDWDEDLVVQIMYRGGFVPVPSEKAFQSVVIYPEDIIPAELWNCEESEWNGRSDVHDRDYWLELRAQGKVWETMPGVIIRSCGCIV